MSTFAKVFVPVKLLLSPRSVEDAAVPPETAPQVTLPFTTLSALEPAQLPVARKRFVVLAVVEKMVVVVAFVVVLFRPVKFWRVVEPVTCNPFASAILPFKSIDSVLILDVANVDGDDVAR